MRKRTNKFNRALKHIKSTKIDDKLSMLEAAPTNSTAGLYSRVTGETSTTVQDPVNPTSPDYSTIDFDIDGEDGKDTSGLFDSEGNSLFVAPPGDNSYILGPMSAQYYGWLETNKGGVSRIGYIRESDRRMVNLGSIYGKITEWDGDPYKFFSNGQLTIEQALWFRDIGKKDGDTSGVGNYRAFYPGPPSGGADSFGRYLTVIVGIPLATVQNFITKIEKNFADLSIDKEALANFAAMLARSTNPTNKLKDLFGEYLTPPAAEYSANIAKSILQNKPITVKQSDIPKGDIDKLLNNIAKNVYASPLTVSVGNPTPYADDNIYVDKNGDVQSNIGPNGELGYYKKNQTGNMGGGTGLMGYGNPLAAAGQAQIQVVYPTDGSEPYLKYTDHAYHNLNSTDPGEVPDKVKATLSAIVHTASGKSDPTKPNTGAMSGYPPNIKGDVKTEFKIPLSQVPQEIQDKAKFEIDYQNLVKQGKVQPIKNQYNYKGKLLSESRKIEILKNIKKPVVVRETKQKKYKVSPGKRFLEKRAKTNFQGMNKLVGDVKPQKPFKKPDNIWSTGWQKYNAKLSQDKKNIVLEKIGEGKHAWNYMLNNGAAMDAKNLEEFWGKNPDFYSYFFNGKKYRPIRKEQVKGDYIVFLVDEFGANSNMLQSELNEKLAEEDDKKLLVEYEKLHGKFYNKLDPISANSMPPTGDPEIDAIVNKQKTKSKTKLYDRLKVKIKKDLTNK